MSAMRAQRIGDALLRSGPSPLLSFLAPSVSSWTWASIPLRPQSHTGHLQSSTILRCLATKTSPLNASTAAARKPDDQDFPQRQSSPKGLDRRNAAREITASIMNSNKPKPRPNSSRITPLYTATGDSTAPRPNTADLFKKANQDDKRSKGYLAQKQGRIEDGLDFEDSSGNVNFPMDYIMGRGDQSEFKSSIRAVPPPIRLDAFIGRSEEVAPDKGMDLGRALKKLEVKCNYNNVRGDVMKQRFHERPGLKRKRLKSERWKKRFKEGFTAVVAKVKDMRNRGW